MLIKRPFLLLII